MPVLCDIDPAVQWLVDSQDGLLTRRQALDGGYTRRAIAHRLERRRWIDPLPGVYLTTGGEPTRRQHLLAALLYAGPDSAIDGLDACVYHGIPFARRDPTNVYVVVPWANPTRNIRHLVVRRTKSVITTTSTDLLRYVDPATAAIVATRPMNDPRRVLAVLSDALQRRTTTYDDLMRAHVRATPRNALLVDDALEQLGARVRSVAENDFRLLSEASEILPPARYNWLLRLPGGRTVSPDALYVDAGLVHETNGRRAHEREDLFADMQERHDALTVAGFTVLHNTPHRIRTRGRVVISEVERCYLRLRGNGLPPGVVVLEGAD